MSIKTRKTKKGCKVTIDGELTIYQAAEVCEKLKQQLEQCAAMEIDLQSITEIDTAGVQILLALKRDAVGMDKAVGIVMHSEPVVEAFELMNVAHEFGDPIVLSGRAQR